MYKRQDIDLQTGNIEKHKDIIEFLNILKINREEYCLKIGKMCIRDRYCILYKK